MAAIHWTPLLGAFDFQENRIIFHGKVVPYRDLSGKSQDDGAAPGIALCDAVFRGGQISARMRFSGGALKNVAGIIIASSPSDDEFWVVMLGTNDGRLVGIRRWTGKRWAENPTASVGVDDTRRSDHDYAICVSIRGSDVRVKLDGVEVLRTQVPGLPNGSPIGIWTFAQNELVISDFSVESIDPTAFVVMQYTAPYNELYAQVIKPICEEEFRVKAVRSDETYGPGVIIGDIEKQINESRIVIAEITPTNANVYYEVGYAHALRKPTILIAENKTALPFDVSPFRVLMYENSIDGKAKVETGLRNHLKAILSDPFS